MRLLPIIFLAICPLPALAQDCTAVGRIEAMVNGNPARVWETRDCSLGAVDISAHVSVAGNTSFVGVTGFLPELDTLEGRLSVLAEMPARWRPVVGPLDKVEIVLLMEDDWDGPRYVSGADARFELTRVDWPQEIGDGETRMVGTFGGTLCRASGPDAPVDPGDCLPVAGRFDSLASVDLPYAWFRDGVWPWE